MIKLNHLIRKNLIYEGLIHSVSQDVTVDMIQKWSGSSNKFDVIEKTQKIQLNFKNTLDKSELDHLLKLINNMGWFVSAVLIFRSDISWEKFNYEDFVKNNMDRRWLSFQLEAKYDLEMDIYDYDIVYHISPTVHKDKILKMGLVPKSKEKITSHPERIYLIDDENDIGVLAFQFHKNNTDVSLSLFRIDFKNVRKNDPSVRIFNDPNFKNGFYTLSNIPPKFITWDGEIDLSE